MLKKKFTEILLVLFFLLQLSNTKADTKEKIIENINNIETLKFDFIQTSFDKNEDGVCFLKRPHFLKCLYNDKNGKQLIINRKTLVIFHKKYNKVYYYPVSKSYFLEILNRNNFTDLVTQGILTSKEDIWEIKYYDEKKGKIIFYFDSETLNLSGWNVSDANNNNTLLKMKNLKKNEIINNNFFSIPLKN